MNLKIERKLAGKFAKTLTAMCVRHTELEDIHAGILPVTKTGDYSDVKIIDADGNEIPWNEASRISNAEMKTLMKQIVNRLYTYFIQGEDSRFQKHVDYYERCAGNWDDPEPDIDPRLNVEK
ncbi:MAG: hypothetical protein KAJ86_03635 [Alphaproteobacteria bacterium]|nr:hypothetical protein [Alphaproteobacteria bacterium]